MPAKLKLKKASRIRIKPQVSVRLPIEYLFRVKRFPPVIDRPRPQTPW